MASPPSRLRFVIDRPLHFALRVLRGFGANQGVLLAGAVAFYTLLSIVPLLTLILVVLSQVMDQHLLLQTAQTYIKLIAPGKSGAVIHQAEIFLRQWKLIGAIGLAGLLFFSSLAFSVLERAISVIFYHRVRIRRRHFLMSAAIPYLYIMTLTAGFLVVSTVIAGLHAMEGRHLSWLGHAWSLSGAASTLLYLLGIVGEVLLLSSLYLVLPTGRPRLHHALIGGASATLLWEIVRRALIWYFNNLSLVNVVYGSFATVIVILLSFEAAALIFLLGAQVIAEYERIDTDQTTSGGFQT